MRRTDPFRLSLVVLALLVLAPSLATREAEAQVRGEIATTDAALYFPLQVGNHWLYARRSQGGDPPAIHTFHHASYSGVKTASWSVARFLYGR